MAEKREIQLEGAVWFCLLIIVLCQINQCTAAQKYEAVAERQTKALEAIATEMKTQRSGKQ